MAEGEMGRCRCGNRVPVRVLKDGLCRACVREEAERKALADEQRRLDELMRRYWLWRDLACNFAAPQHPLLQL